MTAADGSGGPKASRPPDGPGDPEPLSNFSQLLNIRVKEARPGVAVVTAEVDDRMMNMIGVAHGGVPVSVMDTACGIAATTEEDGSRPTRVVTLSLNTQFVRPVHQGTITATARKRGGGQSTVMMDAEVHDAHGHLLAFAQGVFKRIRWPR